MKMEESSFLTKKNETQSFLPHPVSVSKPQFSLEPGLNHLENDPFSALRGAKR